MQNITPARQPVSRNQFYILRTQFHFIFTKPIPLTSQFINFFRYHLYVLKSQKLRPDQTLSGGTPHSPSCLQSSSHKQGCVAHGCSTSAAQWHKHGFMDPAWTGATLTLHNCRARGSSAIPVCKVCETDMQGHLWNPRDNSPCRYSLESWNAVPRRRMLALPLVSTNCRCGELLA